MQKICPTCKAEYGSGEQFCPIDAARLITHSEMNADFGQRDPLIGTQLDKYRVIRKIGEGGMGLVYEAEHTVIEKRVALKVLREDFSTKDVVVERFRQEAKSASRIGHQHIVDISDFGVTPQGWSYFVMEYLEGHDLGHLLSQSGTIEPQRLIKIVRQCCQALGAAHGKGIVHRDMKPENVFLIERHGTPDFVKIVDFGIAKMSDLETDGEPGRKLTKTGMIFGTPEYMSPEQAAGKDLDHRVDIYAMGIILYECLTGRVPFVGDTFMAVLTQHMFEEPPPMRDIKPDLNCSQELELVIAKALEKNADKRFQTMAELDEALDEAAQGRVSVATMHGYNAPTKVRPPSGKFTFDVQEFESTVPTSKTPMMIFGGALGALVLGGLIWVMTKSEPSVAETQAVLPITEDPLDAGEPERTTVAVHVITSPEGAEILLNGAAGCRPTPCELEIPRGEPAELLAELRGYEPGELSLSETDADQTVQIALSPEVANTTMQATMQGATMQTVTVHNPTMQNVEVQPMTQTPMTQTMSSTSMNSTMFDDPFGTGATISASDLDDPETTSSSNLAM